MKKNFTLFIITVFLLSNYDLFSQTFSRRISVPLSALVQESPPKIILKWAPQLNNTGYKIYRKSKEAVTWGTVIKNLSATDTMYIDSNITSHQGYEYCINEYDGKYYGYGYIWAGIKLPEIDQKGMYILKISGENTNIVKQLIIQ